MANGLTCPIVRSFRIVVRPNLFPLGRVYPLKTRPLLHHRAQRTPIRGFLSWAVRLVLFLEALSLAPDAVDNVLVLTLPPGQYIAQLRGTNGSSGAALIEVYDIP